MHVFRAVLALFLWACVTVAPMRVAAQGARDAFGSYLLDVWRAQDGVRLAFTSNLVQTRDGYLWLSSQSGITRFDGQRFKAFSAADDTLLTDRPKLQSYPLLEDGQGRLWVGTDIGLLTYRDGRFSNTSIDSVFLADQVNAATVDRAGFVWAETRSGRVYRIAPDGTRTLIPGTIVSYAGGAIAVDATGDVWIAAGPNAVYRVHDNALAPVEPALNAALGDATLVFATRDSAVWFGTTTALLRWRRGRLDRFPVPPSNGLEAISRIAEDDHGGLWVGTHGAGLLRFDGVRFTRFTTRDGLSDDRVIDILADRDGNMWVATRDGLNRFRPIPFRIATVTDGLPASLPGGMLGARDGTLWLAPPTGGLFRGTVTPPTARFTTVEAVRRVDRVSALAAGREGAVWVGHVGGSLSRVLPGASTTTAVVDSLPPVTDVVEDADGTLWIGTWRGLFQVRRGVRRLFDQHDGLPDVFIHRLLRDSRGVLWVATQTGVARADDGGTRFERHPLAPGRGTRALVLFEAPRGTLWLGNADGLLRVTGTSRTVISTANGLPDDWVGAAEWDGGDVVWLGQLAGLTRVRLGELGAVADGRVPELTTARSYRILDGLPGGDPGAWPHPWSLRDSAGQLWFAMGHGLARITPTGAQGAVRAPAVHIEEVSIDGADVGMAGPIIVPPGARRLELRYTGVDLSNGPAVRFRYRLEGFDTTWTAVGTQRTVAFTRLAAGSYRFRVAARPENGEWSANEAMLDVQVLAPIYRRTWFLVAAGVTLALMLWITLLTVVRTRGAAIRDERSRLARDIHDSLLQGLGGITLQLHAVASQAGLPESQQSALRRILDVADGVSSQAREAIWDIRTPELTAGDLHTDIEHLVRPLADSPRWLVGITTRGRKRRISPEGRVQLLRIVGEAISNACKHADASRIDVELRYDWRALRVMVRDDGTGFAGDAATQRTGHWGILGMSERASRIGATLTIDSAPGRGTIVTVRKPYRRAWHLFG